MTLAVGNNVDVRLFVGCLLTPELKVLLEKSHPWNEEQIVHAQDDKAIKVLRHEGKEYLGWHTGSLEVTISEIEEFEEELKLRIEKYCPSYESDRINIFVFPQIFIS